MSDLEKGFFRLLFDALRKNVPPPHLFPVIGVISAVIVAIVLSKTTLFPPLEELLTEGEDPYAIVLFGSVVLLAVLYTVAGLSELLWAQQYWKEQIPAPQMAQLIMPVFISGALVVMAYWVPNVKAFSVAYLAYCMADTSGCILYLQTIAPKLLKAKESGRPKYHTPEFDAVITFYIRRWWMKLHIIKFLLALSAVALARFFSLPTAGYLVLIFVILSNEMVVWSWRFTLYKKHRAFGLDSDV